MKTFRIILGDSSYYVEGTTIGHGDGQSIIRNKHETVAVVPEKALIIVEDEDQEDQEDQELKKEETPGLGRTAEDRNIKVGCLICILGETGVYKVVGISSSGYVLNVMNANGEMREMPVWSAIKAPSTKSNIKVGDKVTCSSKPGNLKVLAVSDSGLSAVVHSSEDDEFYGFSIDSLTKIK